jgi:hypothetical protein
MKRLIPIRYKRNLTPLITQEKIIFKEVLPKMKKILFLIFLLPPSLFFSQVNIDFESTAAAQYVNASSLQGWLIESASNNGNNGACCTTNPAFNGGSSECFVVTTPQVAPFIGTVGSSPLGGSKIIKLNDASPGILITRVSNTFTVNASNNLLQYAFCGALDGSGSSCCNQPFGRVEILSCTGSILACYTNSIFASSQCFASTIMTISTQGIAYTNWQVRSVDLSPFTGSCITVRFQAGDNPGGAHFGYMYYDAKLTGQNLLPGLNPLGSINPVNYCPGATLASITGPLGYTSYSWSAASNLSISPSQASLSAITITNPVQGSTYTLSYGMLSGCTGTLVYTLNPSTVAIAGIGSNNSCVNGASGSATVQGTGSAAGYNYLWSSNSNTAISTASIVSGLSPGIYSVNVTASGSSGCGASTATVNIVSQSLTVTQITKPYCSSQAYLGVGAGSNFQWYQNTTPISSGSGGNAATYTVTSPANNLVYYLSYTTQQGCKDSIMYTLSSTNVGSLVINSPSVCPNTTNATATISLPNNGVAGLNYFFVNALGNTPAYSASLSQTSFTSITLSNLSASGSYTVNAFDGSCIYNTTFITPTYIFDFTASPQPLTLCSGAGTATAVYLSSSSPNGVYSYSWAPASIFTSTNQASTFITPTLAPGTQTVITFSVTLTPSVISCPLTKTFSVTAIYPLTPTITAVPPFCRNSSQFSLSATPVTGSFSGGSFVNASGVVTPSLANAGSYQVTYVHAVGGCSAATSTSLVVLPQPTLSIAGNTAICAGQSASLTVSGASNYLWSTGGSLATLVISPPSNTVLTVTGTSSAGCSGSAAVAVNSASLPVLNVSGNLVCAGKPTTVTVSGAAFYLWNTGNTSNSTVITPTAAVSYTVMASNTSGCQSNKVIQVTVTPMPKIVVSGNFSVCAGEFHTYSVNGADSLWWDGTYTNSFTLVAQQSASYQVTGVNNPGNCSTTKNVFVNVAACTSLIELMNEEINPFVYPNPATGSFSIRGSANATINIFNLVGEEVFAALMQDQTEEIDCSGFAAGFYIVKVSANGQSKTQRIIINQ